ncbi:MAG: hypothetical protein EXX96DRAFT_472692, partial [Benjaminiella poitrasii]
KVLRDMRYYLYKLPPDICHKLLIFLSLSIETKFKSILCDAPGIYVCMKPTDMLEEADEICSHLLFFLKVIYQAKLAMKHVHKLT